jgi:preprotein translocase subunit SecG
MATQTKANPKTLLQSEALTPLVTTVANSLGLSFSDEWFAAGWGTNMSAVYGSGSSSSYVHNINTYIAMLRQPWIAAAAKVRIMLMLSYLQEYKHEDTKIEEDIRTQFKELPGSFKTYQSQMASALYCGASITEKWHSVAGKKAVLAGLNWVDPRYIRYKINDSGDLEIRFKKGDLDILLEDVIHIKNDEEFNFGNNPAGVATLDRAVPFWEQYRLVMIAMAIAAQRQATPLLVGKNSRGTEESTNKFLDTLEKARNSGVVVIDIEDAIESIAQETDGAFFVVVLRVLRQSILMSFLVPETILGQGESGSGDSNLNAGHTKILRMNSRTEAGIFGEKMIEQIVRPIVQFNYGSVGDWGSFPLRMDEPDDPNGLITALNKTVEQTILGADEAVNRIRELAGM